jgi:hypothetical protein
MWPCMSTQPLSGLLSWFPYALSVGFTSPKAVGTGGAHLNQFRVLMGAVVSH